MGTSGLIVILHWQDSPWRPVIADTHSSSRGSWEDWSPMPLRESRTPGCPNFAGVTFPGKLPGKSHRAIRMSYDTRMFCASRRQQDGEHLSLLLRADGYAVTRENLI